MPLLSFLINGKPVEIPVSESIYERADTFSRQMRLNTHDFLREGVEEMIARGTAPSEVALSGYLSNFGC